MFNPEFALTEYMADDLDTISSDTKVLLRLPADYGEEKTRTDLVEIVIANPDDSESPFRAVVGLKDLSRAVLELEVHAKYEEKLASANV